MNDTKILEFKKDGFDVEVFTVFDEDADTSFIGEYTDDIEKGIIIHGGAHDGEFYEDLTQEEQEDIPSRGREFRGFKPYAGGEKVGSKYYKKYAKQDYERMEGLNNGNWCFLGIVAKAFKNGIELGYSSLWGFESDAGQEYFESEGEAIAEEAIQEAKQNLKRLCESRR